MTAAATCIVLAACSYGGGDAPSRVLNTRVSVRVADRPLSAPVAEVGYVTKPGTDFILIYSPADEDTGARDASRLARDAAREQDAVRAGSLTLSPGRTWERQGVNAECAPSSPSWKCRAGYAGVMADLPERVIIADIAYLKQFKSYGTTGGAKLSTHLSLMMPFGRTAKVVCAVPEICTATLALSPYTVAIWFVRPNDRSEGTGGTIALRQGLALARVAGGG